MSVNKVGRPSLGSQRTAEILAAMGGVVAREGLTAATVGKVADAAGLQRTLVIHYFKDRAALVAAFLDQVVARYGDEMLLGDPGEPLDAALKRAFRAGFYDDPADLVIWTELVALSGRDAGVQARLRVLWEERWLPQLEDRLRADFPAAATQAVRQTVYALAALVEAHWSFQVQGVGGPARERQALAAARTLLGALAPQP